MADFNLGDRVVVTTSYVGREPVVRTGVIVGDARCPVGWTRVFCDGDRESFRHPINEVAILRCPNNDRGPQPDAFPKGIPDIVGCGSTNVTGPDDEGLFDCDDCGMWFDPKGERSGVR